MLVFWELDPNSTKEAVIALLEVSPLWVSKKITATTGELILHLFLKNFGSKIGKYHGIVKLFSKFLVKTLKLWCKFCYLPSFQANPYKHSETHIQ